jgi:hypothetical protein
MKKRSESSAARYLAIELIDRSPIISRSLPCYKALADAWVSHDRLTDHDMDLAETINATGDLVAGDNRTDAGRRSSSQPTRSTALRPAIRKDDFRSRCCRDRKKGVS